MKTLYYSFSELKSVLLQEIWSEELLLLSQMQETALMKAAKNGHVDAIQLLINYGCDEEIVDKVCIIILYFILIYR